MKSDDDDGDFERSSGNRNIVVRSFISSYFSVFNGNRRSCREMLRVQVEKPPRI